MKPPSSRKARERVLSDEELALIWPGTDELPPLWAAAFKLLILTSQRKNEVIGMEWAEVDLDAGLWNIPGRRTKNGRAHEVPLTPLMVEILKSLPRIEESTFVFTPTGKKPMAGQSRIKQALDAAIERAESTKVGIEDNSESMPHWTVHDIWPQPTLAWHASEYRRTARTRFSTTRVVS
jgi:integrase